MAPLDLTQDTSEPEATRLGRKRDHTRDPEILEATLDVLAECGFEGMTIDAVAARAKAGKATVYRRWSSKAELVLDAIACMKRGRPPALPDTGSLRGDLVAMIKPQTIEEGERKLRIMSAAVAMLSDAPELADAVDEVIVRPRVEAYRVVIERAIDRGEVRGDVDVETLALVMPAMVHHRVLMQRKPVDREFLVALIDAVIVPAATAGAS